MTSGLVLRFLNGHLTAPVPDSTKKCRDSRSSFSQVSTECQPWVRLWVEGKGKKELLPTVEKLFPNYFSISTDLKPVCSAFPWKPSLGGEGRGLQNWHFLTDVGWLNRFVTQVYKKSERHTSSDRNPAPGEALFPSGP